MRPARKKGFTLIELLVVIAIVGVLAAVVLIAINPAKRLAQARDSGRKSDIGQIATGAQAYFTTQGRYPTALTELTGSGDLKTIPKGNIAGVCNTAALADYTMTGFPGANPTDLIVSVCIESPTTSGFSSPAYWEWCSDPGTAREWQFRKLTVPCT